MCLGGLVGCGQSASTSFPGPLAGQKDASIAPGFSTAVTRNTTRIGGTDSVSDAAAAAASVLPSTSPQTRPHAITLVDKSNWQGAIAAASLVGAPVGSPTLLSDNTNLPAPSASAIDAFNPAGTPAAGGAQILRVGDATPTVPNRPNTLVARGDAYQQAQAVDQFASAARKGPPGNVIIASGDTPAWAMPAAAWAARSGDPILFTTKDNLPGPTRQALTANNHPNIFVLGPPSVIGPRVESDLKSLGTVKRIQAPTPEEEAVQFARFSAGPFGFGATVPGFNFTIASTNRPADAAAGASLGSNGVFAPLLLTTDPAKLPPSVENYLLDIQPGYQDDPSKGVYNHIWVLGDDAVLSREMQGRLDEIAQLVPSNAKVSPTPPPPPPKPAATKPATTKTGR
jgi:hypothetical protein